MSGGRRVKLLTTGGTIATRESRKRTAPQMSGSELANSARQTGIPPVELEPEDLGLRPSWSLRPADMDAIAHAAIEAAQQPDVTGVVVTHGTTTLEYTAYLTDLRHADDAPIVFTGAMRRADAHEPDGPANLRDAITVAAHPLAAGLGTLVVFAGRILSAREAWKQHRDAPDAFVGLEGGVGNVSEGNVSIDRAPARSRHFTAALEPRAVLVKAYPGASRELVDAAVGIGARGLVVEGLPGVGGVPNGMQSGIRAATEANCAVVLASRAPAGAVPASASGGTGEPLAGIGLISAGDLSAEKAWVLLMVALGETNQPAQVRRIFEEMTGRTQ